MVKYVKQQMSPLHADGKQRSYYRVPTFSKISADQFLDYLEKNMGRMSKSVVDGALNETMNGLINWFAAGHTITVPHLGTFRLAIGPVKNKKDQALLDESGVNINSANLCIKGVRFIPSVEFMDKLRGEIRLEGDGLVRNLHKVETTPEERLAKLKEALKTKPFIKVIDYVKLTGLQRSSATKELASFAADPESGIFYTGRKSHKLYILRN